MYQVSAFIAISYILFMSMAFSTDPRKKYYNRLFEKSTYSIHLLLALALAIFGFIRIKDIDIREVGFLGPLFYLVIFKLLDFIVMKLEGRHVFIVTRGDSMPSGYKWWLDGIFSFLSIIVPLLLTMLFLLVIKENPNLLGGDSQKPTKIDVIYNYE